MQGPVHIADPDCHMRDASGLHGSLLSLKSFLFLAAMTWSVAVVHPWIVSPGLGCSGLSPSASRGFWLLPVCAADQHGPRPAGPQALCQPSGGVKWIKKLRSAFSPKPSYASASACDVKTIPDHLSSHAFSLLSLVIDRPFWGWNA